jgi:hypothetical protein
MVRARLTAQHRRLSCRGSGDVHSVPSGFDAGPVEFLDTVRQTFANVTDRFANFQAQAMDVHIDFPLFQRLALPVASVLR